MEFAIKDIGTLRYFLRIKVNYFFGEIFLSQGKHARDILLLASMLDAYSISTPLDIKDSATSSDNE